MALNNPVNIIIPDIDSIDNDFLQDVLGNKEDTISGNSIVALVKQVLDSLSSPVTIVKNNVIGLDAYAGTATSGETGADIITISVPLDESRKLYSLLVDISGLTNNALITIRMYTKINTVEKKVYSQNFRKGTNPDGTWVIQGLLGISSDLRVEIKSNKNADINVDIGYEYMIE